MRTGLCYRDVFEMFWVGHDDATLWVNKRRNTILGRWHQIKLEMWSEHLQLCELQTEYEATQKAGNHAEEYFEQVPF